MTSTTAGATLRAAARATNRHYDLPPEVFAAFLGRRMKYTCGLYQDVSTSLDQAQESKLHFIAACLGINGAEKVLDVGCGWGALTFFLAESFGCQVTAVTPSAVQAAYMRDKASASGLSGKVRVLETSVYDLDEPPGAFNAAAMVGVVEHMPDHTRAVANVARLLGRDGRLYLSASCFRNQAIAQEFARRGASRHVAETIFGYATLRPFSVLVQAVEDAGLSVCRLTDLTGHYHRTVGDWLAGVRRASSSIDALVPGLAAELTRYLETTNTGWGHTTKHYALAAVRNRWGSTEIPR